MKAMIFAAGLGTRLRPMTDTVPKAMVQVGGQPMLKIVLDRCYQAGIDEVVINVHYLSHIIIEFLATYHRPGMKIYISDESDAILETGGGLLKAKDFFNDGKAFLVANADVLTNIDIRLFFQYHFKFGGIASLAVRNRDSKRKLCFDVQGRLIGRSCGDVRGEEMAFSGYHILQPEIFNYIQKTGKFSITEVYLELCREHAIFAYPHQNDIWIDIGTIEKWEEANQIYTASRHLF
ncbi:MAG: nucleotidyltransferase family protein [Chitinophagales bacterium]|nr:nucleotidyltransferase family protein [Chitinophagales bacterium]MCZ2393774.1 nucleotidyltransferase family protein [Chitinophagales bacterium]